MTTNSLMYTIRISLRCVALLTIQDRSCTTTARRFTAATTEDSMRTLLCLAVVLAACSKAETPAVDSTTAVMAAAPMMLTAADVGGTWNGMSMGETSDSVTNRWTTESTDDTHGTLTIAGSKDAIPFTRMLDGDSMIVTSNAPYANPADAKGPKLNFRSVGRLKDGKLVGTVVTTLADKPDSVVARGRWEATRAP